MKVMKNKTLTAEVLRSLADSLEVIESAVENTSKSAVTVYFPTNLEVLDDWSENELGKFSYHPETSQWVFNPAKSIFEN